MPSKDLGRRVTYLYALLTGITGLFALLWLFVHPATSVDLATLLAFTLFAVLLSVFRIPVGAIGEVGLAGAVLLGAALVGGPAWAGWVGFITGLFTGLIAHPAPPASREQWAATATTALFDGGRNTLAVAVAWWAYRGLGGRPIPLAIDTTQTLAVVVLCLTYASMRCLWLWMALLLRRTADGQSRRGLLTPACFLAELFPLPTSVLVAATFVWLGWPYFLLLALLFIGLSALGRRMVESLHDQQEELALLRESGQIKDWIADTPDATVSLGNLACQICERFAPCEKLELGLYNASYTQVYIQVSMESGTRLPPMHIPITPKWEWLSELDAPQCLRDPQQIDQLPFSLPPLGQNRAPRSALFVPIPAPAAENTPIPEAALGIDTRENGNGAKVPAQASPIGAIVLLSAQAGAFSERDVYLVGVLAAQLTPALARAGLPRGAVTGSLASRHGPSR
jgi:hypothetical protein